MLNGQEIKPDTVADCFYSINLEEGDNQVEMVYKVGNVVLGSILSVCGIIGIVVAEITGRKYLRHKPEIK